MNDWSSSGIFWKWSWSLLAYGWFSVFPFVLKWASYGLGIAGAALALATKESIENLIASSLFSSISRFRPGISWRWMILPAQWKRLGSGAPGSGPSRKPMLRSPINKWSIASQTIRPCGPREKQRCDHDGEDYGRWENFQIHKLSNYLSIAFISSKNPFTCSSLLMDSNFSSALLFFFRKSFAPSIVYLRWRSRW